VVICQTIVTRGRLRSGWADERVEGGEGGEAAAAIGDQCVENLLRNSAVCVVSW